MTRRKRRSWYKWGERYCLIVWKIFLTCQVLSRDSVTVSVDAVVYYRVSNPTMVRWIMTNFLQDAYYRLQSFYMRAILMITTLLASNPTIVIWIQYFGNWLLMTIMMTKAMKWRRDIIHNWINERHDDMRWCQHLQSLIAECYQTEAQWQCVLRLQWFQQWFRRQITSKTIPTQLDC